MAQPAPAGLDEFISGGNSHQSGDAPEGLDAFIGDEAQQAQYGTGTEQLKAGAEGLARGATFGLSDVAESKLLGNAEAIKGRKEANPGTSLTGEIAGNVGTLGLTGGASELLGIGKVLGAGVEGAALGAGQSLSDSALGDPSLNAQKILSRVGFGFALGSGLGALSKAVEPLVPAVTKKLSGAIGGLKEAILGTEEAPTAVAHGLAKVGSTVAGESPEDWASAMYKGLNPENTDRGIREYTNKLADISTAAEKAAQELYKEPKLPKSLRSISDLALEDHPDRLARTEAYEQSYKNFKSSFMKGDYIDPGKVKSFFNKFDDVGQDLRKAHLNDFLSSAEEVVKASENKAGFEQAHSTLSSHIEELTEKHEELGKVASAIASKGGEGYADSAAKLVKAYAVQALGVPKPLVGAGLLALDAYKSLKNPYQAGALLNSSFNKLQALGEVIDKSGQVLNKAAQGIFSGSGKGAVLVPSIQGYDKRVKRINELATDPRGLMDHLQSNTHAFFDAAPNISQSLHTTVLNGMQFLKSKIPHPGSNLLLSQEDWEPSPAQKAKFNAYYDAVEDPLHLLKQIKSGDLSNEAMEAVAAVHPDLLKEMKVKVMEGMDPKKVKNLDQSTKIALAKFLEMPLDSNMLPLVIANNQQAINAQKQQAQEQAKAKPSKTGMQKINVAERNETESQDLEEQKA